MAAQKYIGNPEEGVFNLKIVHVPTGESVEFPAYLENLSDLYSSTWQAEDVYGRMDPITTFVNTRRAISVSWNVPAHSYDNAKRNLEKINKLMTFLYPLYSNGKGGATAINQGPLVRIQFGNLICQPNGSPLLGYLNGFTFDPRVEEGMFYSGATKGTEVAAEYYPKTVRLNTEMNVLHEHELGFKMVSEGKYAFRNSTLNKDGSPTYDKFPYVISAGPGRTTNPRTPGRSIDLANSGFVNKPPQLVANPSADPGANGPGGSAVFNAGGMPLGEEEEYEGREPLNFSDK